MGKITISDIIFGLIFIALICLIHKNINLKKIISKYNKNPVEIDLELATYSQIIGELRNRSLKHIVILSQFDRLYSNDITVETSGLSSEVIKDIMSKVYFAINNDKQEEQE